MNPISGKMALKNKLFDIVDELSASYTVTVCLTKGRNHAKELAASAEEQGFDLVVCAGGDGTLNETVSGLMESGSRLPVGYIPAGSTNDFAAGLGLKKQPAKAARAIVEGSLHQQDIGLFDGDRRFTYIASFGAFTETSYNTDQNLKNLFGHMAYVLEGMKSLPKIKGIPMKLVLDDKEVEDGEWLFGAVTNATTIGGVLRLKDEYLNFHDGIFEIVLIRNPKNLLEMNKIITGLVTYEYDGNLVKLLRASKVTCHFGGELSWSLDGEQAIAHERVEIENLHNGIQILY